MAKKVSKKSAAGLAARTGAKVTPSKPAARTRKSPYKQPKSEAPAPAPAPAAPPPPPTIIADNAEVVAAIEGASTSMQSLVQDLMRQVAQLKFEAAKPPTQWIFDFERDNMGRIKRIKASVPDIKKLLN